MTVLSAPGPMLQRLNTWLHQEPIDIIFHALFWTIVLLAGTPMAIFILQLSAAVKLVQHYYNNNDKQKLPDPKQLLPDQELAVVITGCDSGFGKELALCMANAGYVVFAGCLDHDQKSIQELTNVFPNLMPLKMDVTKEEDVQKMVQTVTDWLTAKHDPTNGGSKTKKRVLHALINNAGVGLDGLVDWMPLSDFQKCMDVNFIGLVRCCKAFLPLFKNQSIAGLYHDARILNMVSMAGLVAVMPGLAAYGASKSAAQAFSQCLRNEVFDFNIQVATINPTFHATPMVQKLHTTVDNRWQSLSEEIRTQYGEAYFRVYRLLCVTIPNTVAWKVDNVTEQVLRQLQRKRIPPQVVVGMDSYTTLLLFRLCPPWIVDVVNYVRYSRGPPAAMMPASK